MSLMFGICNDQLVAHAELLWIPENSESHGIRLKNVQHGKHVKQVFLKRSPLNLWKFISRHIFKLR